MSATLVWDSREYLIHKLEVSKQQLVDTYPDSTGGLREENGAPVFAENGVFKLESGKKYVLVAKSAPTTVSTVALIDNSDDVEKSLCSFEFTEIPTIPNLIQYFNNLTITSKIPLEARRFDYYQSTRGFSSYFVPSNDKAAIRFSEKVLVPIINLELPQGTTEDSYHGYWDISINNHMRYLTNNSCEVVRNSSRGTDTDNNRNDTVVLYRGKALFHGEEKGPNTSGDPRYELSVKIVSPWPYIGLDYVLGYYAIGTVAVLVAISKDRKIIDLKRFQLSNFADRVDIVIALAAVVKLFPLLYSALLVKVDVLKDYDTIKKTHESQKTNVIVTLYESNGTKEWTGDAASEIYERVMEISSIINANNIPNVVRISPSKKLRGESYKVTFVPRGMGIQPTNLLELVKALSDVLNFLQCIHLAGFIYRDLRWPNILKYKDQDGWFVVDLDDVVSMKNISTSRSSHLAEDTHAPELRNKVYDSKVDIWSIGYLLQTTRVPLPPILVGLRDKCLVSEPTERPSLDDIKNELNKCE